MKITGKPKFFMDNFYAAKNELTEEAFGMFLLYHGEAWDALDEFLGEIDRTESDLERELEEAGYFERVPAEWVDEGWIYNIVPSKRVCTF